MKNKKKETGCKTQAKPKLKENSSIKKREKMKQFIRKQLKMHIQKKSAYTKPYYR